MSLEIASQIAGILSCIFGLIALVGLKVIYKIITKQKNSNNITVQGDAVFDKSFNLSNKVEKYHE